MLVQFFINNKSIFKLDYYWRIREHVRPSTVVRAYGIQENFYKICELTVVGRLSSCVSLPRHTVDSSGIIVCMSHSSESSRSRKRFSFCERMSTAWVSAFGMATHADDDDDDDEGELFSVDELIVLAADDADVIDVNGVLLLFVVG